MDCCDLTGSDPSWTVQQASGIYPEQHGTTELQQPGDRLQSSHDQPYTPVQQTQRDPPLQPAAASNRQADSNLSSAGPQRHQAGYGGSSSNNSRTCSYHNQRPPSTGNPAWAANNNNSTPQGPRSTYHEGGSWGSNSSYMQEGGRGMMQQSGREASAAGWGRGRSSNGYSSRPAPYGTTEASSWGSTRSDSALDRYQGGHRGGFSNRYQQQGGTYGNLRSGSPGYNGYSSRGNHQGLNGGCRDFGGRGCNSGSNSSGFRGSRGVVSTGFRPGSGGQGSVAPCWVKQGCWLVPRPGSSSSTSGPACHAAAIGGAEQLSTTVATAETSSVAVSTYSSALPGVEKVVVIMRGLPGSGKSTRAAQIVAEAEAAAAAASTCYAAGTSAAVTTAVSADAANGTAVAASSIIGVKALMQQSPAAAAAPVAVIHSTDSYFVDAATGRYTFNPELLSINHQRNLDAFCASLAEGVNTVIVDNTNIQPWQVRQGASGYPAAGVSDKRHDPCYVLVSSRACQYHKWSHKGLCFHTAYRCRVLGYSMLILNGSL